VPVAYKNSKTVAFHSLHWHKIPNNIF